MGKSYAIRLVIETDTFGSMEWRTKDFGCATQDNLAKWMATFNESLEPGGVNEHLGQGRRINHAKIVRQAGGEVLASVGDDPDQRLAASRAMSRLADYMNETKL